MKISLSFFALFIALSATAEPLFEYNSDEINAEFSVLQDIEQLVLKTNSDLEELRLANPGLVEKANLSQNQTAFNMMGKPMPIVGPFWWGCCLGIIGLVLVYYVTDNDKEQVKNALIGCLVGTILFGSIWALWNPFAWF